MKSFEDYDDAQDDDQEELTALYADGLLAHAQRHLSSTAMSSAVWLEAFDIIAHARAEVARERNRRNLAFGIVEGLNTGREA
ncbi:MAG: hypothetical protein ACRD2R_01395 [Terriglobales bacterium]